jgi:hypothetical protein
LPVDVKVGILHIIADAIYSTQAGKIREAVANSRDNGATWIVIIVDQTSKSLCIFDNGTGISEERFKEIFESIGYGLLQQDPEKKLSFFGLGLMSIFQLGNKVRIFTRPENEDRILELEVDTAAIFAPDPDNKKRSISSLEVFLTESDMSSREKASAPLLNEYLDQEAFGKSRESFTEIIIEGIHNKDLAVICKDEFVEELRKHLPLKVEKNEPFLQQLTGIKNKEIRAILKDRQFCKTIDVYIGIQEENTIEPLWKYFPAFSSNLTFPDDNVYVGISSNGDFAYYFIHSVAVDLHRSKEEERETGFWVRNQNFLVKAADFLERPGPGRKIRIIDEPLKGWVFGEIFHKDMNPFLSVSRIEFLFKKEEFKTFHQEVKDIVSPLNHGLRDIYAKKKRITEGLIEPFSRLTTPDGALKKTQKRVRELVGQDLPDREFNDLILDRLKKARNKEIEKQDSRVDILLAKSNSPIVLGEDEDAFVKIDPTLKGKIEDYLISWDSKNRRVVVSISPDLFNPQEVVFFGRTFEVFFVAEGQEDPGISVDVDNTKIYINPFNQDLTHYSLSILDVYVALQIAKAISKTKDELVKNTLGLLGAAYPATEAYVTPLGDDLRRTMELAGARR